MKKSVKKSAPQSFYDNAKIRKDWGMVKPYGSVIGDKRSNKKRKIARKEMKEAM